MAKATAEAKKSPDGTPLAHGEGSLKAKHIDKLPPSQRRWTDNVLHVLKLPSKGSQARLMADSIASAENISQNNRTDSLLANHLKDLVLEAGNPPWKDMRKAMTATDAKVHLDLLSIPPAERRLEPLDPLSKGVNQAFWINHQGAETKSNKSFLCKPATIKSKVDGVPDGSEVFREALVSRAAQTFASQTGIDIGMPETHVVKLSPSLLPPEARPEGNQDLTCSVQEARANSGDLKKLGSHGLELLKPEQVAGMAVFDAMSLNTDRHSGNLLVDKDNNLIPIDHGAGLIEPSATGNQRIVATMAGPHNALLRVPAAHEPMTDKMLKQLKALDPDAFRDALKRDRNTIGKVHDSDDPNAAKINASVSDGALESARRSASFVKLAAKNKPPLSPAAIQIALGSAAVELLDPKIDDSTFRKLAQKAIDRAAPHQEVLKQICVSSDGEYIDLCRQVEALGWVTQERHGMANVSAGDLLIKDPLEMIYILQNNIKVPKPPRRLKDTATQAEKDQYAQDNQAYKAAAKEHAARLPEISKATMPAEEAKQQLLTLKRKAAQQLMSFLAQGDRAQANDAIQQIERPDAAADRLKAYATLIADLHPLAFKEQEQRYVFFLETYTKFPSEIPIAKDRFEKNDAIGLGQDLNRLYEEAQQGRWTAKAQ